MSPAPSGIYGVGFWPSAPCNRPPLIILRRTTPGLMPDKGRRPSSRPESECANAAILRSACEFHGTRYYETARLQKRRDFPIKFQPDGEMELLRAGCRWPPMPEHAIHPPIHRADSFARGGESHPPPCRRSSQWQGAGAAASDQRRVDAGRSRHRRQGLSRRAEAEGLLLVPPEDDGRA
jgi:hypothetical protein